MARHSAAERSAATRYAQAEARRRAASVARFALVISISIVVALLLFGGHKIPLN